MARFLLLLLLLAATVLFAVALLPRWNDDQDYSTDARERSAVPQWPARVVTLSGDVGPASLRLQRRL